jgi:hypothetical protein
MLPTLNGGTRKTNIVRDLRSASVSVVVLLALAALFAAAIWLQVVRETRYPLPAMIEESLYLTRQAANRIAFSFRPLGADLYWIRAIQYYGSRKREIDEASKAGAKTASSPGSRPAPNYDLLYPLLDITTTLDPQFSIAYRFGSIFLAEPYPAGPGRPDLAIALLEKGAEAMPGKWEYMEDIGFVYYWNLHNYPKAAAYFNRGADLPGAPWWLRSLAATTLAKGGQRSASRLLWRQMLESAADERARDTASRRLQQLDALDQIEQLQRLVDAFAARTGTVPTTWPALIRAGALPGPPVDPRGEPYELSASGQVKLSARSPLFPLPVEPTPSGPAS